MRYGGWATTVAFVLLLLLCSGENIPTTVLNEEGQVFDCIDIHSQPALKHPLLKKHTVQMEPSSIPDGANGNLQAAANDSEARISSAVCPSGTIPVLKNYTGSQIFRLNGAEEKVLGSSQSVLAMLGKRTGLIYGTKAKISVYEPEIGAGRPPRMSGAVIEVLNEDEHSTSSIIAGWMIDPSFYGDERVHFEIQWEEQGKGCTNLRCPGFVQVSSKVSLGGIIKPVSTIRGKQYALNILIFKDPASGNWWLKYGKDDEPVGYWPKELFTQLATAANQVYWYGVVDAAPGERYPPMGSGMLPTEGDGEAAYFKDLNVVDGKNTIVVPGLDTLFIEQNEQRCFTISQPTVSDRGVQFFFGGPSCPRTAV